MPEILIHRCTLRVVRRAGWSWGPQPKRIAQDAVRVLPELLAKTLAGLFPDDEEDRQIAAPISIRIPIRWSDLEAATQPETHRRAAPVTNTPSSLEQKVESALRAALGLEQKPSNAANSSAPQTSAHARLADEPAPPAATEGGALARLLLAWQEQGVLDRRLQALPIEDVEVWHHRLSHDPAGLTAPRPDATILQQLDAFLSAHANTPPPSHRAAQIRKRILIATETAARFSLPLQSRVLWEALDRELPLDAPPTPTDPFITEPTETALALVSSGSPPPIPVAHHHPDPIRAPSKPAISTQPQEWTVKIDCALPFLVLGPLARLGYFSALDAVLEANHMSSEAPLFAAALAYKVLDPPQRGWRRTPASMLAAAVSAGSQQPFTEDSLNEFTLRMAPHTAALDLVLADSIIAGHTAGEPVTLFSATGPLLLDTEGCFPLSWPRDSEETHAILRRLDSPVVLIPEESAESAVLRQLDEAGATFVVSVPPARGEQWQRIHPSDLWTNSRGPISEPLRRAARAMTCAAEEARGLAKELVRGRPSAIHATTHELNRTLTLAAAIALGLIAWKLWRSRGRTTPQQVLERFADLEARVRFDATSVYVDLPLGRRQRELQESGLLASVSGVPWFGRRRVEFGKG